MCHLQSVQKQFVIDMLDSRRNATSYRIAPYSERCEILKLQPLKEHRQITDALFAYHVCKNNVKDDFLSSNRLESYDATDGTLYGTDYLMNQPLSLLISSVNMFADAVV